MSPLLRLFLLALMIAPLAGCPVADDDDSAAGDDDDSAAPEGDLYAFDSRFEDASSVSYSGQVFRQALMLATKDRIGGLTDRIDTGWVPAEGDVAAELMAFYAFDSASAGSLDHGIGTDPATLQTSFDDISSGKDLRGKLAGNDATGHHLDYSAGFVGWDHADVASPDDLVLHWFDELDALARDRANGNTPLDPTGAPIASVFVTPAGQDLQQLVQKFLGVAIAFSQGADDYLDDDTDGKGLLSDHSAPDGDKPYTALEHAWDEAWGYFGGARDYADYSDGELAQKDGRPDWQGHHDTDGDGFIDLNAEYNFGHALNAAKRDRGAVAATDFTADAWNAFLAGRRILADAGGALTDDELSALQAERDAAVAAWENALAATVVHYINDVLADMAAFGTDDYSFADHAKHWSELKGFALGLQFNPRSPVLDDFAELHALLGQAPVLPSAGGVDIDVYADDLRDARALLGAAYGFAAANLGDDEGAGGW